MIGELIDRFDARHVGLVLVVIMIVGGAGVVSAASGAFLVTVEDSSGDVPDSGSMVIEDADGEVVHDVGIGDGAHTFEGLEDGEYNLTVKSYGYTTAEYDLSVDDGVTVDGATEPQSSLDVTLADATEVTTTFNVESLANEEAIEDADIELILDGEVVEDASTDSTGAADITDYEGTYDKLRVSADGYQTVTISDYEFGDNSKTVQLQEGSDGWFGGGDGSGSSSSGNGGLFIGLGVIVALIVAFARLR